MSYAGGVHFFFRHQTTVGDQVALSRLKQVILGFDAHFGDYLQSQSVFFCKSFDELVVETFKFALVVYMVRIGTISKGNPQYPFFGNVGIVAPLVFIIFVRKNQSRYDSDDYANDEVFTVGHEESLSLMFEFFIKVHVFV